MCLWDVINLTTDMQFWLLRAGPPLSALHVANSVFKDYCIMHNVVHFCSFSDISKGILDNQSVVSLWNKSLIWIKGLDWGLTMAPDKLPHPPRPSGEYNKHYVNRFFLKIRFPINISWFYEQFVMNLLRINCALFQLPDNRWGKCFIVYNVFYVVKMGFQTFLTWKAIFLSTCKKGAKVSELLFENVFITDVTSVLQAKKPFQIRDLKGCFLNC